MSSTHDSFNESSHGVYVESPHGVRGETLGDLYVGGAYFRVGGVIFRDLARWDHVEETWNQLGTGLNAGGSCFDLHDFQGKLVIVGSFTQMNGVSANRIALWDGTTATTLGTGFSGNTNVALKWKGELYVGGSFAFADGTTAVNGIARWDVASSSWQDLDGGFGSPVGGQRVTKMFIDPFDGNLVVTGLFTHMGTAPQTPATTHIAKWNGTAWSKPAGTSPLQSFGTDTGLGEFGGKLINGSKVIDGVSTDPPSSWDGAIWTTPFGNPAVNPSAIFNVTGYQGKLYCAGLTINSAGGNPAKQLAVWDGSSWDDQGGGITIGSYIGSQIRAWNGKLVYTGSFTTISGVSAKRVAVYDPATDTFEALGSGIDDGSAQCAYQFKKLG